MRIIANAAFLAAVGKNDECVSELRTVLRLKPKYPYAELRLADKTFAKGNLKEAEGYYLAALRANPELTVAYNNLGKVYLVQGHISQAVVQFNEALRRNPGYKEAEENLRVAKAADAEIFPGRAPVILNGRALHLNLDDAWPNDWTGLSVADARSWGPHLRFSAPPRLVEQFYRERRRDLVALFLLYGSGDFHYLTALRLRSVAEPIVLVSFDNHPDWDVRPPKWACGGWVNRALDLANVRLVSVWGCGNFECWWPHQIFGNRRAERAGILEVHPWADNRPLKDRQRKGAILRENWREHFEEFAKRLAGRRVYVTDRSRLPLRGRGGDELGERSLHSG